MVIDSSAVLAILSDEPERGRFVEQIEADANLSSRLQHFSKQHS